jgi:hypothetical protein
MEARSPTMTSQQLRNLDQRLKTWRAAHPDAASLRAAYRARVLEFTLNSMALENEPVERQAVEALRTRPGR